MIMPIKGTKYKLPNKNAKKAQISLPQGPYPHIPNTPINIKIIPYISIPTSNLFLVSFFLLRFAIISSTFLHINYI